MATTDPERATDVAVTVTTRHGPVGGRSVDGTAVFRGVPYGAPTTGSRRLAPPQPPEPWSPVLDCTSSAVAAPQNPSILETALGADGLVFDEDCLRLNVFTTTVNASAPVMVWFHGGGFETGTAAGTTSARRGPRSWSARSPRPAAPWPAGWVTCGPPSPPAPRTRRLGS
jgi:para-nitrobenzyl esterase